MSTELKLVSSSKCFEGQQFVYSHFSDTLQCNFRFTIYQPPKASETNKVPVIYFLSGLTSSEQEFIIQSGFQKYASENNVCVVGPDTFPRDSYPKDVTISQSQMASMYVDATTEGWKEHYKMYSYVTKELIQVIEDNFPFIQKDNRSVMGHSMGGHAALITALLNPGLFKCTSAFAPLYNLEGAVELMKNLVDLEAIKDWDATCIIRNYKGPSLHILIDQGADDYILADFIPERFLAAAKENNIEVDYRLHEGYDHGWFFLKTFIGPQIEHHAKILHKL